MKLAILTHKFALPHLIEDWLNAGMNNHHSDGEMTFESGRQTLEESPKKTEKKPKVSFKKEIAKPQLRRKVQVQSENKSAIQQALTSPTETQELRPGRVVGLHSLERIESDWTELKWHKEEMASHYTVQYNDTSYDDLRWKTLCVTRKARLTLDQFDHGEEYYFRVKAHSKTGNGSWSGQCRLRIK